MYSIGLDISNLTFTASCVDRAFTRIFYAEEFQQTQEGWDQLLELIASHAISDYKIVMENTGVYSERICYYLYSKGIDLYVEPPHQVHNAFYEEEKTDPIDSREIAEYGFRFPDRLHHWQPRDKVVEQVQTLLTTREHLTKMRAACKNTIKSLKKKHHTYDDVVRIYEDMTDDLDHKIDQTMEDIKTIINTNPLLQQKVNDVLSIKNTGIVLTVYLLVCTEGFTITKYTTIAKYAGVCPLQKHQSGTVAKKKRSRGVGPKLLRKNLYLAAMRLRRNHPEFKKYFERKVAEGKAPRLVINNIENRLLRIICGVLKSGKPYIDTYRSQKPD